MSTASATSRISNGSPPLESDHYVHRTPPWLVVTIRVFLAGMGGSLSLLTAGDWNRMPWPFIALSCVLSLSFMAGALYRPMWEKTVRFAADRRGIFFPCNELVVAKIGSPRADAWLLIPWEKISHLRVAESCDGDLGRMPCVAFDVVADGEERRRFFAHVDVPLDRKRDPGGVLPVAYADRPPSPESTVRELERLRTARAYR